MVMECMEVEENVPLDNNQVDKADKEMDEAAEDVEEILEDMLDWQKEEQEKKVVDDPMEAGCSFTIL